MDPQRKIVFQGKSKKGKEYFIRYPVKEDLEAMWKYINTLSKERTFIRFQGEEMPMEEEREFLEKHVKDIEDHKAVTLLAFSGDELIGNSGITMQDKTERHLGVFGISLAKEFRGEGIGPKLMDVVLEEAISQIPMLEIITLGVFSNNHLAKGMYEKRGFKEYGRLPQGVKLEHGYDDHMYMYKRVR